MRAKVENLKNRIKQNRDEINEYVEDLIIIIPLFSICFFAFA